MTIKCAALLRLSSKKQVQKQNFGRETEKDLPGQRKIVSEFMEKHPEFELVKWFEEAGVSAFQLHADERNVLQDVLEGAKDGLFQKLILWKFDRLSRISEEYMGLFAALRRYGVEVWSAMDNRPLKYKTSMDKAMRFFEGFQAESYSEAISAAVIPRMRQLAAEGRWMGGKIPYGYRLEPKVGSDGKPLMLHGKLIRILVPDPETAPVVREMFNLYVDGYGMAKLARHLNERRVLTTKGALWTPTKLMTILDNPLYAGMVRFGLRSKSEQTGTYTRTDTDTILVPGAHEPLVDAETFERVQKLRKLNWSIPKRQRNERYVLAGLTRCATCGGSIGGTNTRNVWNGKELVYLYYRCQYGRMKTGCHKPLLRVERVEDSFVTAVEGLGKPDELRTLMEEEEAKRRSKASDTEQRKRTAAKKVADMEEALRALNRAYLIDKAYTTAEFTQLKTEFTAELEANQAILDEPEEEAVPIDFGLLTEMASEFRANWQEATPAERKMLAMSVLDTFHLAALVHDDGTVELRPRSKYLKPSYH